MSQRASAAADVRGPGQGDSAVIMAAAALLLALVPALGATVPADAAGPERTAEPAATGALAGTVRLGPQISTGRMRFRMYPSAGRATPSGPPAPPAAELANVVVFLEASPALARRPGSPGQDGPFRLEQRQEAFLPHVLAVPVGATVEFPNDDPIYHNVFSLSKAATFDLGRYPRGSSRSVRFDHAGIVKVYCHIHPDMSAVVMVLDHPFYTIPDDAGRFVIPGIPPGDYVVTGWHERARPLSRDVTIEAGRSTEIQLNIPLEDPVDDR